MSPVRKPEPAPDEAQVIVEVKHVEDASRLRRLTEILSRLLDEPAPDERR
jgi:hypothetical protein